MSHHSLKPLIKEFISILFAKFNFIIKVLDVVCKNVSKEDNVRNAPPLTFVASNGIVINPPAKNVVVYSDLTSLDLKDPFRGFSLKYVYKGHEYYKLGSGEYRVTENEILYAVKQPGQVYFDNTDNTRSIGLCVTLDESLFLEALRIHTSGCFSSDPELCFKDFSGFPLFLEGVYAQKQKRVSLLFKEVCKTVENGTDIANLINEEWFFSVALEIVTEELKDFTSFLNLKANKVSTKKEILKRLSVAKEFMDESFLLNPSISEIARTALLSDYHFFRSFKLAYNVTPYQYLMQRRLDHAKYLLEHTDMPLPVIASVTNFSHQFAFAKAFRQKFNTTPTNARKRYIA